MKLLSRSKSKHDKEARAQSQSSRTPQQADRRPSTSHKYFRRQSRFHDGQLRPQTADAAGATRNSNRVSVFEAFEIQSGNDVFAFPRPLSARTVQSEFKAMASHSPSTQSPPTIGLACGSPSHPPPEWHNRPQKLDRKANAKPTRLGSVDNAYQKEMEDDVAPLQPTNKKTWRRIGSLFRRPTKVSRPQKSQQDFDDDRPRLQRRTRTEPINIPGTESRMPAQCSGSQDDALTQPQRYAQSRARSTAKMQSILGVDTLTELEQNYSLPTLTLSSSRTAHSHPLRSQPLSKPDAPQTIHRGHVAMSSSSSNTSVPLPPRLELALPSYKLERYSIMFENVLDPKPSLFDRRRSRLVTTGVPPNDEDAQPMKLATLSPVAPSVSEHASPDDYLSAQALPLVDTSQMESPLPPEVPMKNTPPTTSIRLSRADVSPALLPSPLRTTNLASSETHDACQTSVTFFDSQSSDEDDEDPFSPQTPSTVSPEYSKVQVFSDTGSQHIAANSTIHEHKEIPSSVWHAMLPPEPQSTTSSRFSLDVPDSPKSPSLPRRSRSLNGRGRGALRSPPRSAQVAVARSISVSKMRKGSVRRTDSSQDSRPKLVNVGALAHPKRKSSVLDDEHERRISAYYGLAL